MLFESFGLSDVLLRAIADQGYTSATPIQDQAIPAVMEGRDLLASAQTGTGKTASFALPLLEKLHRNHVEGQAATLSCLVLTPTRELASQVYESFCTYGKYTSVKSAVVFGGVNFNKQLKELQQGVNVIIATPGRLLDHVEQKTINLSGVDTLVLDEADRMLDMGFIRDIRRIIQMLPRQRQNLMFSATFSNEMKSLANTVLRNPALIHAAPVNTVSGQIDHVVHPVDQSRKLDLMVQLLNDNNWEQVLVFTRMKHTADKLAKRLEKLGIETDSIHGDKSQPQRIRALEHFKNSKVRVLVATDVASRGLDIPELPIVINFELPNEAENYIHRIGRTGRAGNTGLAISLMSYEETPYLKDIERLLHHPIRQEILPGYEPDPRITRKPLITTGNSSFGNKPGSRRAAGLRTAGRLRRA